MNFYSCQEENSIESMNCEESGWEVVSENETTPEEKIVAEINKFMQVEPGVVAEIYRYLNNTSDNPSQVMNFLATMVYCASLFGRRFALKGIKTTHPNLYATAIAPSGYGKTEVLNGIKKIAIEADRLAGRKPYVEVFRNDPTTGLDVPTGKINLKHCAQTFIRASDFTAGTALFNELKRFPIMTQFVDEYHVTIEKMYGKRAATFQQELRKLVLELFGSSDNSQAGITKVGGPLVGSIKNPCFSMMGVTTPEAWYEVFQPKMIGEGYLARSLTFFEERTFKEYSIPHGHDIALPGELVRREIDDRENSWGMHGETIFHHDHDTAFKFIEMSESQIKQVNGWRNDCARRSQEISQNGELGAACYERVVENALKLALIFQVSRRRAAMSLDQDLLEFGYRLSMFFANHFVMRVQRQADRTAADMNDQARAQRQETILRHVRKAGKAGIGHRDLHQKIKRSGITSEALKTIMSDLIQAGDLVTFEAPTRGRKKIVYRVSQ